MKFKIALLFLLISYLSTAQKYTVIHVTGEIIDQNTSKKLTRGYSLTGDPKLKFGSASAKAAVLSSDKGRFILQAKQGAQSKSDITYALSSIISPVRGRMSSRSGALVTALDFEKRFESQLAWIGDTLSFKVSRKSFPLGDSGLFYVRYNYRDEAINKRLKTIDGSFNFIKSDFYSVDGSPIEPTEVSGMELFYFKKETSESKRLTSLALLPVKSKELLELNEFLKIQNPEAGFEEFHSLVVDLFGACSPAALKSIL